jgi:hypothetical protein
MHVNEERMGGKIITYRRQDLFAMIYLLNGSEFNGGGGRVEEEFITLVCFRSRSRTDYVIIY